MNFSDELMKKAKNAKSFEELRKLAEENGVELTGELEAKFNSHHSEGAISDDELSNVAGGCGDDPQPTETYRGNLCPNHVERHFTAYGGDYCKFYEGDPCCENCCYFMTSKNWGDFLDPSYAGYGYCFRGID